MGVQLDPVDRAVKSRRIACCVCYASRAAPACDEKLRLIEEASWW